MSDPLQPHGMQHTKLPSPLSSPRVCSNSCPLSQWCYLTVSSSVAPFSASLQSFPASGSFPMSQFIRWPKYWSFSFSISPSNVYSGLTSFEIDWFDFLVVQLSIVFSNTTVQKHKFFSAQLFYGPTHTSIDDYWKNFDYRDIFSFFLFLNFFPNYFY